MTEAEKRKRDIETLLESIRISYHEAAQGADQAAAKTHIEWCIGELKSLVE